MDRVEAAAFETSSIPPLPTNAPALIVEESR
jgi:hypothetical protein